MNQLYKYILFFFVLLLGISSAHAFHKYYVSICEIAHNPKMETLEVTFKIFTDDLERALEQDGKFNIELGTVDEHPFTDSLISNYIMDHFELIIDEEVKPMFFLGKEAEIESTWCYIEVYKVANMTELQIYNDLLLDVYEDQNNLIHLDYKGEKSSVLLRKGHVEEKVSF